MTDVSKWIGRRVSFTSRGILERDPVGSHVVGTVVDHDGPILIVAVGSGEYGCDIGDPSLKIVRESDSWLSLADEQRENPPAQSDADPRGPYRDCH
jgi:hypothetical protein